MRLMEFDYYVELVDRELNTIDKPAGIYRTLRGMKLFQSLRLDAKWHWSDYISDLYFNQLIDVEMVSETEARIAITNTFPRLKEADIEKVMMSTVERAISKWR